MVTLRLILLVLAFLLLFLAGLNVSAPRVNLMAMGLALWVLALLVSH